MSDSKKIIELFRCIRIQLIIIGIIVILKVLEFFGLPSIESVIPYLAEKFKQNGYFLVSACSFLENIFGFNAYFPGSIVILTSMSLTAGNPTRGLIMFLFIYFPSIFAQIINYFLGKNLSLPSIERKRNFWILFFSTMWHPTFASITSTQAESMGLSIKEFLYYYLPTSLFWNCFWAVLMYKIGGIGNTGSSFFIIFYLYLAIWTLLGIIKFYKIKKH